MYGHTTERRPWKHAVEAAKASLRTARPGSMDRPARSGRWVRRIAPLLLLPLVVACEDMVTGGGNWTGDGPPPPLALQASYWNGGVDLSWELHPQWQDETFRVYSRRAGTSSYTLVAEVSSCGAGVCGYRDLNVLPGRTYEYYVASVDVQTAVETASDVAVEVDVPQASPPPAPGDLRGIALDGAVYLAWDDRSRDASDFGYYRIYLEGGDGNTLLLGETDSEGFLDLLVENGNSYAYFVTAIDNQGHESQGSALALATPRPDYHGEFLYAFEDQPSLSGFRFPDSEATNPVLPGTSGDRDFRLEVDTNGWWLVPAPGVEVHQTAIPTSALRCGPAADAGCTDVSVAPSSNWGPADIGLDAGYSYVLRMPAGNGEWYYGVVRMTHVGWAQDGAIAIFDWAFQLQPGNPNLSPVTGQVATRGTPTAASLAGGRGPDPGGLTGRGGAATFRANDAERSS
jgi:hypothetical protein